MQQPKTINAMRIFKLYTLIALLLAVNTANAQDDVGHPRYSVLVDFMQPVIGQVQAGVLIPAKPHLDVFVFGRYNYNYVPNYIAYSGYYTGIPTCSYYSSNATETGFTLGGQARFLLGGKKSEYSQYLKPRRTKVGSYFGGWLEYGSSISESTISPYQYSNVEGKVPNSTLTWTNISGGALAGLKIDLSKSLLVDIYTGLGVRYMTGEILEPGAAYDQTTQMTKHTGTMHSSVVDNSRLTARLGLQLGYKF
jgi:hypothetical protein